MSFSAEARNIIAATGRVIREQRAEIDEEIDTKVNRLGERQSDLGKTQGELDKRQKRSEETVRALLEREGIRIESRKPKPDPMAVIVRNLAGVMQTKASSPPMTTGDSGALINATAFLGFLSSGTAPMAFPRLVALGHEVGLQHGHVTYAATNIVAGWISEAGTINMARPGLVMSPMGPSKKITAMCSFTREMSKASNIEQIIETELRNACAEVLDGSMLDDQPASASRTAGIRYGVTALPAVADVASAMDAIAADLVAKGAVAIAYVTGLLEAQQIARLPGTPQTVIVSSKMPPKMMIGLDPSSFVAGLDNIEIGVTDGGNIHEDSAALPLIDAAGVEAKPQRTGWETATQFTRAIFDANWVVGGRVAWVTIT